MEGKKLLLLREIMESFPQKFASEMTVGDTLCRSTVGARKRPAQLLRPRLLPTVGGVNLLGSNKVTNQSLLFFNVYLLLTLALLARTHQPASIYSRSSR